MRKETKKIHDVWFKECDKKSCPIVEHLLKKEEEERGGDLSIVVRPHIRRLGENKYVLVKGHYRKKPTNKTIWEVILGW
jgi:hypothetical protein